MSILEERVPTTLELPSSWAVDSDVHPNVKNGIRSLGPYLPKAWARRLSMDTRTEWGSRINGNEINLPQAHYANTKGTMRPDSIPPSGDAPGSDPEFMVTDLLDRNDLGAAVLSPGPGLQLGGFADADLAAVLATAINEWQANEWLSVDPRYVGSIVVGPRDPLQAANEIKRWGNDPRFVVVYIPSIDGVTLGKRHYYPIYEAAEEFGLPISTHPGGESAGINGPMFAAGAPSYYFEYHTMFSQPSQTNLVSLVAEGVFERFPGLNFVFIESGYAWLLEVMWRMDQKWRATRDEIPWVKREPSEYVLERVRVTSQPMYEPRRASQLEKMFELIHADKVLMFSSDYPHWDTDDPVKAASRVPAAIRDSMFRTNPWSFFNLKPAGATTREGLVRASTTGRA
jgi:predicted TIM-barrel fold metal-dependent hydrolase